MVAGEEAPSQSHAFWFFSWNFADFPFYVLTVLTSLGTLAQENGHAEAVGTGQGSLHCEDDVPASYSCSVSTPLSVSAEMPLTH